jgi:hypothetical protein
MFSHAREKLAPLGCSIVRVVKTHLVLNVPIHRVEDIQFGILRVSPVRERFQYSGIVFIFHGILPQQVKGVVVEVKEEARGS